MVAKITLERNLIGVEDLTLGTSTVEQSRAEQDVTITQINSSNIPTPQSTSIDDETGRVQISSTDTTFDYLNTKLTAIDGTVIKTDNTTSLDIKANVGTSANQIVQLDSSARLPAIDGSQLTGLPSGVNTFPDLLDTPAAFVADNYLKTNSAGTALENLSLIPLADVDGIDTYTDILDDVPTLRAIGNTSGSTAQASEVVIKDEDDMASDSASCLVTQQSVKAYVDDKVFTTANYGTGTVTTAKIADLAIATNNIAAEAVTAAKASVATQVEAVAGSSSSKLMTPERTLQSIEGNTFRKLGQTSTLTISNNGRTTVAHGLATTPLAVSVVFRCLTADGGYAVDDFVFISGLEFSSTNNELRGVSVSADDTNLYVSQGDAVESTSLPNKTATGRFNITASSWGIKIYAWAWADL